MASARATLQRAQAVQLQARQEADRQKELHERRVTSVQARDNAIASLAQADADVAIAQAGLDAAELNCTSPRCGHRSRDASAGPF